MLSEDLNIKLGAKSKKWNNIIIDFEVTRWEAVNSDSTGWMCGTCSTCVNPVTRLYASQTKEKVLSILTNMNFWKGDKFLG
jgi:heterodisulfide reductase subunit C